jgi:hypothetical protein
MLKFYRINDRHALHFHIPMFYSFFLELRPLTGSPEDDECVWRIGGMINDKRKPYCPSIRVRNRLLITWPIQWVCSSVDVATDHCACVLCILFCCFNAAHPNIIKGDINTQIFIILLRNSTRLSTRSLHICFQRFEHSHSAYAIAELDLKGCILHRRWGTEYSEATLGQTGPILSWNREREQHWFVPSSLQYNILSANTNQPMHLTQKPWSKISRDKLQYVERPRNYANLRNPKFH